MTSPPSQATVELPVLPLLAGEGRGGVALDSPESKSDPSQPPPSEQGKEQNRVRPCHTLFSHRVTPHVAYGRWAVSAEVRR
jgi:hypothetical protein